MTMRYAWQEENTAQDPLTVVDGNTYLTNRGVTFPRSSANYNDDDYASKTYANLIYDQYNDYRNRYLPYEKQLMGLAEGTQLLDEQLARININMDSSYSNLGQQQRMMNQRYGLQATAQQQQNFDRNTNVNKALATAHAKNSTRIANTDMQNGILTGASTTQQNMRDIATGG